MLCRVAFSSVTHSLRRCSGPSLIPIRYRATATFTEAVPTTPVVPQTTQQSAFREPDFDNAKDAFKSKSTMELLRAYFVFKMCSIHVIVENQAVLLRTARRLLGEKLFRGLMKRTMYGQFLAGEDRTTVLASAARHRKHDVIPMFAYTAKEFHGIKGEGSLKYEDPLWKTNFDALMDEIAIANDSVEGTEEYAKMSGKYTFLVTPDVLESTTSVIQSQAQLMDKCLQGAAPEPVRACVDAIMTELPAFARKYDLVVPIVPWSDRNLTSYSTNMAAHLALHDNEELTSLIKDKSGSPPPSMTSIQHRELLKLWHWMLELGEKASGCQVNLVIDAEQSYLQLAIDNITIDLMRVFNKRRPVISNTYQNYLKRTFNIVQRDFALADKENFAIGLKPVRGAYIDEERRLAMEKGYEDPINDNYDATSDMYHSVARLILHRIQSNPRGTLVTFATHNIDTVRTIIGMMREMRLTPTNNNISFAQLLGMRDHIAFPLGAAGYPAHKLLHYGPVDQAMAYMSRRLMENRSGVGTANSERKLLGQELKRRMLFRN